MRVIAIVLLLASVTPLAGATDTDTAPACVVTSAPGAIAVGEYYITSDGGNPTRGSATYTLWKESNGVPGLQYSSNMSCGSGIDTVVGRYCVGRPDLFGGNTGGCPLPVVISDSG